MSTDVRDPLPDRHRTWTYGVEIDGNSVTLSIGEYPDGRPGEIWVEMPYTDTLMKGVLGTLSRVVSMLLQDGAAVDTIVRSLRDINYPPMGRVIGSHVTRECSSVTDWVARELEARYADNGNTKNAA